MTVDTPRSSAYLLSRLMPGLPSTPYATTGLAQWGRDLIVSMPEIQGYALNYNYTTSAYNGGLRAGVSATVTLPPEVPVSMIAVGSSARITGGVAEVVTITAISSSGNSVTFTPANDHQGSWQLNSASGGIQELNVSNPSSEVILPRGTTTTYVTIRLPDLCPGIRGMGSGASQLLAQFTGASIIQCGLVSSNTRIRDLAIIPNAGEMTTGSAIEVVTNSTLRVADVQLGNNGGADCYQGISIPAGRLYVDRLLAYTSYRGIVGNLISPQIDEAGFVCNRNSGNYRGGSCALYLSNSAGGWVRGLSHDAGVLEYGVLLDFSAGGNVNEIEFSGLYLDSWVTAGIFGNGGGGGVCDKLQISDFNIRENNYVAGGSKGIYAPVGAHSWKLSNGEIAAGDGIGILIDGAQYFDYSNVNIYSNKAGGVQNTMVYIAAGNTPKHHHFSNCTIGEGVDTVTAGVAKEAIRSDSATLDHFSVVGAGLYAATQSGKLVMTGTETHVSIDVMDGIKNAVKSVASAASVAFPVMCDDDVLTITGAVGIGTITNIREGQTGKLLFTDPAPAAVTAGATIGNTFTATQNVPVSFMVTGGKLYGKP